MTHILGIDLSTCGDKARLVYPRKQRTQNTLVFASTAPVFTPSLKG